MWRVGLYSKREGASDMSGVEVIARDAGVVIEHNNLYSWWRCENCGRRGQDNHSNKSTVRHLLPSLQRKAQSHLKSCPARPSSWQRAFTKPIAVSGLPIPGYFVREHPGYLTEQLGASWLRDHADEGAPLILVSTHANATNKMSLVGSSEEVCLIRFQRTSHRWAGREDQFLLRGLAHRPSRASRDSPDS